MARPTYAAILIITNTKFCSSREGGNYLKIQQNAILMDGFPPSRE